ncbi:MAG: hypothetical protein HGA95_04465 [Caldiserica bacterium]|nr:hypothetical protein [Caldisericota bacterium]
MDLKDENGKLIPTTQVNITTIEGEQNWIRITLEDGAIVKFKPIVLKVVRLSKVSPTSEYQYVIESQNVAAVEKQPTEVKE